jgi:hypothetical protein
MEHSPQKGRKGRAYRATIARILNSIFYPNSTFIRHAQTTITGIPFQQKKDIVALAFCKSVFNLSRPLTRTS